MSTFYKSFLSGSFEHEVRDAGEQEDSRSAAPDERVLPAATDMAASLAIHAKAVYKPTGVAATRSAI
ncbi:hypothetical protein [Rhodoferax sp.]|uniref:hypothetical protein n=1 Tax=Rhodoferax sp. TaxID=50421 RepID=UPI00271B2832|nr:hypothetical protein [Rhodoferax sp.]MDO9196547.1 hypothetical protein [Rhodoferax sp.]